MRAEAKLSAPVDRSKPEMGTWRQHCELAAKGEGADAEKAGRELALKPCPEEVEHLVRWTYELYGRDGFNMGGPNLLSNREVDRFFALRGIIPDPLEIDALFLLNAAYCNPEGGEEEDEEPAPREAVQPPTQRGRQVITT